MSRSTSISPLAIDRHIYILVLLLLVLSSLDLLLISIHFNELKYAYIPTCMLY